MKSIKLVALFVASAFMSINAMAQTNKDIVGVAAGSEAHSTLVAAVKAAQRGLDLARDAWVSGLLGAGNCAHLGRVLGVQLKAEFSALRREDLWLGQRVAGRVWAGVSPATSGQRRNGRAQ